MNELVIASPLPSVLIRDGIRYVNSSEIARAADKTHANVMKSIRGVIKSITPPNGWFVPTSYHNRQNGQIYASFDLTRDASALLMMTLKGAIAAKFKLGLLAAYNATETQSDLHPVAPISVPAVMTSLPVPVRVPNGSQMREVRKALENPRYNGLPLAAYQARENALYRAIGVMLPEPVVSGRHYSTTELAAEHGISPQMLGKRAGHLKVPAHGELRLTTAPHGHKQIEQWYWSEAGKAAVAALMEGM